MLTDRKTDYLLPPSVDDRLTQDHLARFVVEVIDGLAGLFVQVLEIVREMRLLKLGTVCLDGTKIHAIRLTDAGDIVIRPVKARDI